MSGFLGVRDRAPDAEAKWPKFYLLLLVPLCLCLFHREDSPSRSPSKVEVTEKKTTVLLESGCPRSPMPSGSRKCSEIGLLPEQLCSLAFLGEQQAECGSVNSSVLAARENVQVCK